MIPVYILFLSICSCDDSFILPLHMMNNFCFSIICKRSFIWLIVYISFVSGFPCDWLICILFESCFLCDRGFHVLSFIWFRASRFRWCPKYSSQKRGLTIPIYRFYCESLKVVSHSQGKRTRIHRSKNMDSPYLIYRFYHESLPKVMNYTC